MEGKEIKNFGESNPLCLIDVSSEDDCLIVSPLVRQHKQPLDNQDGQRSRDSMEFMKVDRTESTNDFEKRQEAHQMSELIESNTERKFGKCNLRKSLAWDASFFTSDGVLDPEELNMIGVGKYGYNKSLPGIQEDALQSNDSISSLDSDDLNLENIEANLFVDARASIQKFIASSSKIPSAKPTPEETKPHLISSKKVSGASSDKVIVNKSILKKSSSDIQKPRKITQSFVFPQATEASTKIKVPTVLPPKPPKIVARVSVVPAQQDKANVRSVPSTPKSKPLLRTGVPAQQSKPARKGDNRESFENANAKGKRSPSSKCPPRMSDFHRRISTDTACSGTQGLKKPTLCKSPNRLSSGTSLSTSIIKKKDFGTGSLIGSSSSRAAASGNTHKSLINFPKKKIASKIPIPRAPTRTTVRHKTEEPGNSKLSAYMKSNSKPPSSSISPTSSISELSCETSSSATANNGNSKTSEGEAMRGCSELAKSSGLRMPSPKIGFFDGASSGAGQVPNRKKSGKLQFSGTATSQTVKIASQEIAKSTMSIKDEPASSSKIPTSSGIASSDQNEHPVEDSLGGAEISEDILDCDFTNKKETEAIIQDAKIDSEGNVLDLEPISITQWDSTKVLNTAANGESCYTSSEAEKTQSVENGEESDMKKVDGTKTSEHGLDSNSDAELESCESCLSNTSDLLSKPGGSMFSTDVHQSSGIEERSDIKLRGTEEAGSSEYVLDFNGEVTGMKNLRNAAQNTHGSNLGTSTSAMGIEIGEGPNMNKAGLNGPEWIEACECVLGSDLDAEGKDGRNSFMIGTAEDSAAVVNSIEPIRELLTVSTKSSELGEEHDLKDGEGKGFESGFKNTSDAIADTSISHVQDLLNKFGGGFEGSTSSVESIDAIDDAQSSILNAPMEPVLGGSSEAMDDGVQGLIKLVEAMDLNTEAERGIGLNSDDSYLEMLLEEEYLNLVMNSAHPAFPEQALLASYA